MVFSLVGMPNSWYFELMDYLREINLLNYESSVLLLGPRMTGKTHLLEKLNCSTYFDLLDPEQEIKYKSRPKEFYQELLMLNKGQLVIIDECQKIPALLNYVQLGIEKLGLRFILSGSSAIKLKREGTNLLAARALLFYLHTLSYTELQDDFDIKNVLEYGSLPKISVLIKNNEKEEAILVLRTYKNLYLQLEIQQEAITRNLGNFSRFLDVAAQYNGQQVVYQNIATSSQVPKSTVANYFDVLEDTLVAKRIWEYQKSEKDKNKPKLYFFDCGVVRAIQNRLNDPPTPSELGHLFETFVFLELLKIRDYQNKPHTFSYWKNGAEIDFLVEKNQQPLVAIECKTTDIRTVQNYETFHKKFPKCELLIASLVAERARKVSDYISILPWKEVLERYKQL